MHTAFHATIFCDLPITKKQIMTFLYRVKRDTWGIMFLKLVYNKASINQCCLNRLITVKDFITVKESKNAEIVLNRNYQSDFNFLSIQMRFDGVTNSLNVCKG